MEELLLLATVPAVAAAAAMGADALADGGAAHCNQMRFYISETFSRNFSVLKFGFFEMGTKFEKIFHLKFDVT